MADEVDVAALARLRPGMPVSALEHALGSRWVPPAPHREGRVDAVARTHGFQARVDRAGSIGEVVFQHDFPPTAEIDGLRMGMKAQEVARARPDIPLPPEANHMRFVSVRSPTGVEFRARIAMDALGMVAFVDPAAVYPEKLPFRYPAPAASDAPGAPFRDPNLKLAVLSSLLDDGLVDLDTPEALIAHAEGRPFVGGFDSIRFHEAAHGYLARYPLSDELLRRVTAIHLDGGNSIHAFVYPEWSGETEHFDVATLAGIEHCPNLVSLAIEGMRGTVDLAQLASLHRLETIRIGTACRGFEALPDLPALVSCSLGSPPGWSTDPTIRRVIAGLRARGVEIDVFEAEVF